MTDDRTIAALLPPSLRARLEHVGTDEPASAGVGYGLDPRAEGPVDISVAPHLWTPAALPAVLDARVMRWQPRPSTVVIEAPDPPTALLGEPLLRDDAVLQLDAHRERFVLLFRGEEQDVVLDVAVGGRIDAWVVPRDGDAFELEGVRQELILPPFDPDPLGDLGLAPWLLDAARGRVGTDPLGPAVATGLVLRLGRPTGAARRRELLRLRAGEPSTVHAWARRWIDGVSGRDQAELEATVRASLAAAIGALDALGESVASDPAAARQLAEDVVESREDAESVRRVLALVGAEEHLAIVCAALDRRALEVGAALADALDGLSVLPDDWSEALSWQEPDAWWALPGDD